ncbi:solute carrier family 15 member 2-like [Entelurus aequoreus]|uniref:solute carrier family 15 member 2-like n=1 Tax=Entelurus aequoreus TaxID=161455 RepID=UPI002B1DCD86|nr:solute carrier family 15 member 2-like [Entelurus aequoreus]
MSSSLPGACSDSETVGGDVQPPAAYDGSAFKAQQDPNAPPVQKLCETNNSASLWFIKINGFCECFAIDGTRAVLTIYFLTYLHWNHNLSTAIYHTINSLCYFSAILAALIADSWIGKYKTIIYLSFVYLIGFAVMMLAATPPLGSGSVHIALSIVGLILIAFGAGSVRSCVTAFGGDQFRDGQASKEHNFFSNLFIWVNAGSLLARITTPYLKENVECYGSECYALSFGVPGAVMAVGLIVFIAGSRLYRKNLPQGNILLEVCNCVGFAIMNRRRRSKYESSRKHWLDWAKDKHSKRLIMEIKMVLRVLVLFIPLPMFWALFEQQGSRWTLQAARMNMVFGSYAFSIQPDQMLMLNAGLPLIVVPLFNKVIYPLVGHWIKITPLRKMTTGMAFAALAFCAAALVEVSVVKTVVDPAPVGKCLLQVFNLAPGVVRLHFPKEDPFPEPIPYLQDPAHYVTLQLGAPSNNVCVDVRLSGFSSECDVMFVQQEAYSLILQPSANGTRCSLVQDHIKKNEEGAPLLRFLNTLSEAVNVTVGNKMFHVSSDYNVSANKTVKRGKYNKVSCSLRSKTFSDLDLGLLDFGASYTIILVEDSGRMVPHKMVDVEPNNVHVTWQIPQYLLMTLGEVMFIPTGLEFSYSQAPASMKSVLLAVWLMTIAFGDVIVLMVVHWVDLEQWKEFLLFAGLLLSVVVVFSIMSYFYTYVQPQKMDTLYLEDKREDDNVPQKNEAGEPTRV